MKNPACYIVPDGMDSEERQPGRMTLVKNMMM